MRRSDLYLADFDALEPLEQLNHSNARPISFDAENASELPAFRAMTQMPRLIPLPPSREKQIAIDGSSEPLEPQLVGSAGGK
jgi:hypothetical protein